MGNYDVWLVVLIAFTALVIGFCIGHFGTQFEWDEAEKAKAKWPVYLIFDKEPEKRLLWDEKNSSCPYIGEKITQYAYENDFTKTGTVVGIHTINDKEKYQTNVYLKEEITIFPDFTKIDKPTVIVEGFKK